MITTFNDGKYLDEILKCMDRLQKTEFAIEALSKKSAKYCSELEDTKDQRRQLESEIVQVQELLRNQLYSL